MKLNRYKLFSFLVFFFVFQSFAQSNSCDTIFSDPATQAIYLKRNDDLRGYALHELVSMISNCMEAGEEPLSQFKVCFTIDHTGKVAGNSFPMQDLSLTNQRALSAKLLTITGWKPASNNGFPVCSFFNYTVSCIE